ncbi:MAG: hypothetical protein CVV33_08820 [Methanomicrobiales archaeon HGW-Methanomicrobiales-4]|nr:MAG: hypothetical protein CVV33_08820 [Methanomicrobiales archaeon HGW-Methanomicrobiales-4]
MRSIRRTENFIALAVIIIILILALGFGISTGNLLFIGILVITTILGTILIYRQIGEVMTDALSDEISGRAAKTAIVLTIIITSLVFASALTFYFTGGWGTGVGVKDNGTMTIRFHQFFPHGHEIFSDSVQIADPTDLTDKDLWALENLFREGIRVRDGPLYFGLACGSITILLAGFYTLFTLYYGRKFEV